MLSWNEKSRYKIVFKNISQFNKCIMLYAENWLFWALLSACFAAMTAIFAKIGIQNIDSDLATLIRSCIIVIVLLSILIFTGKLSNPFTITAKTWLYLSLSALATGASWACYFRALKLGQASKVAPVDKFSVVLVAVFATIFLGEKPDLKDWLGIVLVAGGVLVLSMKR